MSYSGVFEPKINSDDLNMDQYLQNCDIVFIYNREENARLTVGERNVKKYFTNQKQLVKIFRNDDGAADNLGIMSNSQVEIGSFLINKID